MMGGRSNYYLSARIGNGFSKSEVKDPN